MIVRLTLAHQAGARQIRAFSDSQVMVNQITREYEARDDQMIKYLAVVQWLLSSFDELVILRIPREQNAQTDALSKLASSSFEGLDRTVLIEVLLKTSTDFPRLAALKTELFLPDWTTFIKKFLIKRELPEDRAEARWVRFRSERFAVIDATIFKMSYTTTDGRPYLCCLTPDEAKYALKELHEGICRCHMGSLSLARKALNHGYY